MSAHVSAASATSAANGWMAGANQWLVRRIDTPIEAAYFRAGGIMSYVLEQLLTQQKAVAS